MDISNFIMKYYIYLHVRETTKQNGVNCIIITQENYFEEWAAEKLDMTGTDPANVTYTNR